MVTSPQRRAYQFRCVEIHHCAAQRPLRLCVSDNGDAHDKPPDSSVPTRSRIFELHAQGRGFVWRGFPLPPQVKPPFGRVLLTERRIFASQRNEQPAAQHAGRLAFSFRPNDRGPIEHVGSNPGESTPDRVNQRTAPEPRKRTNPRVSAGDLFQHVSSGPVRAPRVLERQNTARSQGRYYHLTPISADFLSARSPGPA